MAIELDAIRDLLNTYKDMEVPLEKREEARRELVKEAEEPNSALHELIDKISDPSIGKEFMSTLQYQILDKKPELKPSTPELKPLPSGKEVDRMKMVFQKIKTDMQSEPEPEDLDDLSDLMIKKPDVATEFLKHRTQDLGNSMSVARILKTIQITAVHNPLANQALGQIVNGIQSTPNGRKMLSAISQEFRHDAEEKKANVAAVVEPVLHEVDKKIKSAGPPRLERE